jgi:MoxR-like ATPase
MLGSQSPESSLSDGAITPVLTSEQLTGLRKLLEKVTVRPEMIGYIIDIVRATRSCESLLVGAGPRATQALLLAARAWAILDQRDFVSPDDIKSLAVAVLEHRVVLRPEFEIEGHTVPDAIESVLREVTVPR